MGVVTDTTTAVANKAYNNDSGGGANNLGGGSSQQQQDPHREVKSREFEKYCWMHRCDYDHNGFEYKGQDLGQNPHAPKKNPIGGNPKNNHRQFIPSTIRKPDT